MIAVQFADGISKSLLAMESLLARPKGTLDEIGQLMVTFVRESHDAQIGLADKAPFAPVTARYAKRKLAAGGSPGRVLFGPSPRSAGQGGELFGSWGVLATTASSVTVGATGGVLNRIKASAHDGGLAQYLGRPELNRLRLGWDDKRLEQAISHFLDKLVDAGDQAPES